ncbi:tRNA1(Val) (adenine(37)-N6)-methyltransferase [Alteromonas sp. PRIM-21]|uniref:tRNA1(Val) (adenine(37)-N6)-methyltransferase n=1 Tax=Alteromonas sp. PRIM-21 TaxID=1454978 RepID=UPI0022B9637A|nr:RNA methyltransferase [Alteromonas sp. PRIM-21]
MKVNTDSLILGSWANLRADISHAPRILDIGTGSGILALMMAQKAEGFYPLSGGDLELDSHGADSSSAGSTEKDGLVKKGAEKESTSSFVSSGKSLLSHNNDAPRVEAIKIDAIEIDKDAAAQAAVNFKNSKWAGQLHIHNCDVAGFEPAYLYDTIISNPPYFESPAKLSNAYNKQNYNRSVARQTFTLSPNELFNASSALLIESGQMYCVYPASMEADIIKTAASHGLLLEAMLYVKHTSDKDPYLCAFRFNKVMKNADGGHADCTAYADHQLFTTKVANENALVIRDREGNYTNEYKALCQPFYLKF